MLTSDVVRVLHQRMDADRHLDRGHAVAKTSQRWVNDSPTVPSQYGGCAKPAQPYGSRIRHEDRKTHFANAFGGAVKGSEPSGGSAFAHRDARFYAEPGAARGARGGVPATEDPRTPVCLDWIAEFTEALRPSIRCCRRQCA